jgi:hypothetical protein
VESGRLAVEIARGVAAVAGIAAWGWLLLMLAA